MREYLTDCHRRLFMKGLLSSSARAFTSGKMQLANLGKFLQVFASFTPDRSKSEKIKMEV